MLNSPLVSLNVHEPLTFDSEICLHPDLFGSNNGANNTTNTARLGSSFAPSSNDNNALRNPLASSKDLRLFGSMADESAATTNNNNNASSNSPLQVGDMIEIRVWDARSRSEMHDFEHPLSPSPAISQRKRVVTTSSNATIDQSVASSASPSSGSNANKNNNNSTMPASIHTSTTTPLSDSAKSDGASKEEDKVTSVDDQPQSPSSPSSGDCNKADAQRSAQSALPPIFPRGQVVPAMPQNSKPPIVQRKGSLQSTAPLSIPSLATKGDLKVQSRHVREVSDMTLDTSVCFHQDGGVGTDTPLNSSPNNKLDESHVLMDMQVPMGGGALEPDSNNIIEQHLLIDEDEIDATSDPEDSWLHLHRTHRLRLSFVMLITKNSLSSLKSSARTQVSLLRPIADLYHLSSYDMVTVNKVEPEDREEVLQTVSADFVLVTIKDQFISRGDMQYFQKTLMNSWIYQGERLSDPVRGILAHAREIRHGGVQAFSGIVTEDTKITYRSRSSRIFWLVQMSVEMWDYTSPYEDTDESSCQIYFDKFLTFINQLFVKWKEIEATHSLTVVFFSRTFTKQSSSLSRKSRDNSDRRDSYGRPYEDHYRMVIENETRTDWGTLVVKIKEAFVKYPYEVGWNLDMEDPRRPSTASQGNILEAVNVTLNLLQYHYLDRDLNRTGNSIVIISAGSGVFEVDKGLSSITYQRMMDHGIGSDMLSLSLPPLHIAPFFLYVNTVQAVESEGVNSSETYYEVPHWMHLSFVSYDSDQSIPGAPDAKEKKPVNVSDFTYCDFDIGPKGFIMSKNYRLTAKKSIVPASPHLVTSAATFSTLGNAAASPNKSRTQATQERQLISGREFFDILEASRPRHVGLMPSSLKALIGVYEQAVKEQTIASEKKLEELEKERSARNYLVTSTKSGDEGEEEVVTELKEWGSLDAENDADEAMNASRHAVPFLGVGMRVGSPLPSPSMIGGNDVMNNTASSPTSSFGSQMSNYLLGVSYDRPLLSSPKTSVVQIQRAPSLDLNTDDIDTAHESDASLSDDVVDSASENDIQTKPNRPRNPEDIRANLRTIMQAFDSGEASKPIPSPKVNMSIDATKEQNTSSELARATVGNAYGGKPTSTMRASVFQQKSRASQANPKAGGIGAALNSYRSQPGDMDSSNSHFPRNASNNRLSIANFRSSVERGLSPLMLPNAAMNDSSDKSRKDSKKSSLSRSLEKRLVHPSEFSRNFGPTDVTSKRSPDRAGNVNSGSPNRQRVMKYRDSSSNLSPSKLSSSNAMMRRNQGHRSGRDNTRSKGGHASRRKKVFNPFRQEDEDEVLAKKSHNRRRWSHVFPLGEIEFKRHAGPNWKSMSAPAILPLSVDYFPTQQDIDHNFTFSQGTVTLSDFDNPNYSSHIDLLNEMVRQRITQDYQLVPPSHINASNYRRENLRDGLANRGAIPSTDKDKGLIRKFLSMGHRLQVLTFDPNSSPPAIDVTQFSLIDSQQNNTSNSFKYFYLSYCSEKQQFVKTLHTFNKYSDRYNWNKVDRILCGDEDRELREGMRFRRIMLAIMPPLFTKESDEQAYVGKFNRLLEYLTKLREKSDMNAEGFEVKIVTSANREQQDGYINSVPGLGLNSMKKFYVQLKKGKRDAVEWIEIAVDSTFDTTWSYRIVVNWLVASSGKVETQIQLLQRRCNQYGLHLVQFPQLTVSRDMFLNPFKAPAIFTVCDKAKGLLLDNELYHLDYIHDGVFYTDAKMLTECIDRGFEFDFGKRWSMPPAGRQFVHRSATLFVRLMTDKKGWVIIAVFGNYRIVPKDPALVKQCQQLFHKLSYCLDHLGERETTHRPPVPPETQDGKLKATADGAVDATTTDDAFATNSGDTLLETTTISSIATTNTDTISKDADAFNQGVDEREKSESIANYKSSTSYLSESLHCIAEEKSEPYPDIPKASLSSPLDATSNVDIDNVRTSSNSKALQD